MKEVNMKRCIVQKYGGTSVADVNKLNKIADLISKSVQQDTSIAIVVSAMGKTTNSLIDLAKQISPNPQRREMDMLLSTGERTTMALLCMALHERGIASVSLTGSQAGIITNARHNNAKVIEVRPFRVQDEMASGKVVVIGGFQGVSYKRDITTLGRGGSDTTAVALAAALNADRCEIYSDIDGVYTADPSVVSDAQHLPEISYQVMQEMSTAGAKVINAHAVQFAKEQNIAIYARSTFESERETIIRKYSPGFIKGVEAVVSEEDICRIRIQSNNTLKEFNWAINFLEDKHIPIKELNVSVPLEKEPHISKSSFIVSSKSVYDWAKIKKSLQDKLNDAIEFDTQLSALSLIGDGLNKDNSSLIETLNLLNEHNISISGITTTSFRISLLVPADQIEKSVKLCHKKWIG